MIVTMTKNKIQIRSLRLCHFKILPDKYVSFKELTAEIHTVTAKLYGWTFLAMVTSKRVRSLREMCDGRITIWLTPFPLAKWVQI